MAPGDSTTSRIVSGPSMARTQAETIAKFVRGESWLALRTILDA
jgi:hypothetical protein